MVLQAGVSSSVSASRSTGAPVALANGASAAPRGVELARRRLGVGAGDGGLDVGGVAALAAEDDLVLAGVGVGHVLVADLAAHHARVALDHHEAEAAAPVDAVVGLDVQAVALLQGLVADVEAVGVLHDELPCAQDAALGTGLVALLGLEVVPHLRELLVAVDLPRGEPGDDLFVRHGERHVGALAVLEAEQLAADRVPAAALLPDLRRLHDRHEHLLAADRIHLLADDLLDLLHDAPAGRQEHVDAGGELAHEAGADHELVAHGLRAGRILFDGGQEQLTDAHGASRYLVWRDEALCYHPPDAHLVRPAGAPPPAVHRARTRGR